MKVFYILLIAASVLAISPRPAEEIIKHHHYTTYFNPALQEPDSVSWDLTADMLCPYNKPRLPFAADPDIVDCPGSNAYDDPLDGIKYSQGHMFNFDEAKCDETDRRECFYMSNMLPQNQHLNAGDWASVEHQERKWAANGKIHIVAGGIGTLGRLTSGVNVPDSCWKAIYHDHQWDGYIMANRSTSHGHRLASHVASFKDFERRTGFHPSSQ